MSIVSAGFADQVLKLYIHWHACGDDTFSARTCIRT